MASFPKVPVCGALKHVAHFWNSAGKHTLMKYLNYLIIGFTLSSSAAMGQVQERAVETQECMEVSTPKITVDLWDAGVEDNDSIRLYLNGKIVLDLFRLSKAVQTIQLDLLPGQNDLVLYALNLGDIPDNTAAMSVNGSSKKSLTSGLKVSGKMNLIFKAPGQMNIAVACPEDLKKPDDDEAKAIRSNPQMALPSWSFLQTGIRLNAGDPARKVEIQDCYTTSTKEMDLLLWDCGVEDNDTISLMVNGQWILRNYRLTKEAQAIPVNLLNGENIVLLYAHNLGDIPNNTAALAVRNKYSQNEVGMMISDQNTCGAIRITYGFNDDFGNKMPPCLDENKIDSTSEPEMVYLNSQTPTNPAYSPSQPSPNTNPPSYPPQQQQQPPVIVVPPPVVRPAPVPPSQGGSTPKPGRQPGTNPGGSGRNTPKPRH